MPLPTRVLVTGGAGFLGSHLVRRLVRLGVEVRVLDDLSGGSLEALPPEVRERGFHRGDVRDASVLASAVDGCEAVVHLAARPVPWDGPEEGYDVGVRGTLALLRVARDRGVARLVHASSSSIYGVAGAPPQGEGRAPGPVSLGGACKVASEATVRAFAEAGAFQAVVLRFFHVYGPGRARSPSPGVLVRFGREVAAGRPPQVHGSGEVLRDFVHVDDAVEAVRLSLERRLGSWTLANVGTGVGTNLRDAAEAVATALGRPDLDPISVDPPPGPRVSAFADLRYSRSSLGFLPKVTLSEGLGRKDFHLP